MHFTVSLAVFFFLFGHGAVKYRNPFLYFSPADVSWVPMPDKIAVCGIITLTVQSSFSCGFCLLCGFVEFEIAGWVVGEVFHNQAFLTFGISHLRDLQRGQALGFTGVRAIHS